MIVFQFIMDLYYLINVPSHYLLTDQSLLPPESLRFFFIDQNWICALVDGALSLGNHGGTDPDSPGAKAPGGDDPVRRAIKKAIDRFFKEPLCIQRKPANPRFGFYLRSAVVARFPDLKVSIHPKTKARDTAPILLRHNITDRDTMLGFFSEKPIDHGLEGLWFEPPGHQQFFSVGNITEFGLDIEYQRQYTRKGAMMEDPQCNLALAKLRWPRKGKGRRVDKPPEKQRDIREREPVFIWGLTRGANDLCLVLLEKLAEDMSSRLSMLR
ncbi:hypothetical protein VTI74DRAFT_11554 [Chaetomium olivicolor]